MRGTAWGSPHLTFSSLILQFFSPSETPDSSQELQQALQERAQLEARVGQVRPCRAGGGGAGRRMTAGAPEPVRRSDGPCSPRCPFLQLRDTVKQLQLERDQYAENLKEDNAVWQQRMKQMSEQVRRDLRPPTLDTSLDLSGHQ